MAGPEMKAGTAISRIRSFSGGIGLGSAGMLVALFYQIFLARMMGAENFGIYTYAIAIVVFVAYILDLGVYEASARYISEKIGAGEPVFGIVKSTFLYSIGLSFLVTVCFYLVVQTWWPGTVYSSAIKSFLFFIPVLYFFRWSGAVLRGTGQNMRWILIEQVSLYVMFLCFVVPAWYLSESVDLVVVTVGVSYTLALLLALFQIISSKNIFASREDSFDIRILVWHGLPLNFVAMGNRLFRRGDVIVIGALMAPQFVGVYKAIYTLVSGIKQLVSPVNNFSLYFIARQVGRGDHKSVFREYLLAVWVSLLVTIPGYCILLLFYEPIYQLVYGDKYFIDRDTVYYLVAGFVVYSCVGPIGSLFNAMGKNWVRMVIVVSTGLINFALNYILVGEMGIAGAALATLTVMSLLTLVYTLIVIMQSGNYLIILLLLITFATTAALFGVAQLELSLMEMLLAEGVVLSLFLVTMLLVAYKLFRLKPAGQPASDVSASNDSSKEDF